MEIIPSPGQLVACDRQLYLGRAKRTLRTRFAVRIVNALLVRTADNAISHGDGDDIVVF